jgi:hypothetical protein
VVRREQLVTDRGNGIAVRHVGKCGVGDAESE